MDNEDFIGIRANYEKEVELFNYRNKSFVSLFPKLNESLGSILIQVRTSTNQHLEIVLHMLVRLCARHYEAIFLLVTSGHGFSAFRTMRSLFEKYVDAHYLHKYPEEIEDFWDYHLFAIVADGEVEKVRKFDPLYEDKLDRFFTPRANGKRRRRPNWSKKDFVSKAKAIGCEETTIDLCYRVPSSLVHSSMREILASFCLEADGSISPITESSEKERLLADQCLLMSTNIIVSALSLLIEHFKLSAPREFIEVTEEFDRVWRGDQPRP